ncbi:hypothetical protein EV193_106236 [Herbihabitans rhizosphaerae]|uniref:Uncharacterized protein n=1 Tax=Herbihabitans rhizosphaerae TaxID=1872711 RepID=A0A4Q7KN09_9PSEU|nr:hypothetical protein [Herbihabitans rhizosphaerae]RZS37001.1 hypothetical protein EV193_106236 [Herbihabitans rhizosphaerae]
MPPPPEGYGYTTSALAAVAERFRSGAGTLDGATGKRAGAVDAGLSSDIVAAALVRVTQIGTVLAHVLDDTAGKVRAANGSYDDIENNNAGMMRLMQKQRDAGYGDGRRQTHVTKQPQSPLGPTGSRGGNSGGR